MAFCLRISSRPRIHSRPSIHGWDLVSGEGLSNGKGSFGHSPNWSHPVFPLKQQTQWWNVWQDIYIHIYIFIFVSDPCVNGSFPHHLQSNRSMLHLPKILMWYLVHPIFVIFWALGMGCTTRIGFFSSKVILTYGCSRMAAALILLVPLVNLRSIVGEFCWGESYGHCSTHIFLVFGVLCLLTFILFFSDTDESFLVLR